MNEKRAVEDLNHFINEKRVAGQINIIIKKKLLENVLND